MLHSKLHIAAVRLAALMVWAGLAAPSAWSQADYSQTRTSSFTYQSNGLLATETVEPDQAQLCVVTTHLYDAYGNKAGATTANCAAAADLALFDARSSSAAYAATSAVVGGVTVAIPAGTFATSSRVALTPNINDAASHTESREYDPRFGAVTKLIGPNGATLATTWELDALGRKTREVRAGGTQTVMLYCLLSGRVSNITSNSAGCTTPGETPAAAVRYEHSEPQTTGGTQIGPWARAYYDAAGRKIRTATQAFDGANQPGGTNRVIVQDTDYNAHGAVVVATQPFFVDTNASTAGGSSSTGLSKTVYDALGRVLASYTTDPATDQQTGGSQPGEDFGSRGSYRAAKTSIAYNGLETTTTDDQGRTRKEEKSPEGKTVRVTDTMGAQIVHQHDAFGNLIQTKDPLGNIVKVIYDARGRKIRLEDPDAGATVYCYDALGQLKAQQTSAMRGSHGSAEDPVCPTGITGLGSVAPVKAGWTTLAYDRLGRLTSRNEPEYLSSWVYDKDAAGSNCGPSVGKLCQSGTSHGITRKQYYDSLGRPLSSRTDVSGGPSMATAVGYDAYGRLATQTYPTGLQLSYVYTAKGFLAQVKNDTAFNAAGSNVPIGAGTVLWEGQSYNAWGKAELQVVGSGAGALNKRAVFEPYSGRLAQLTAGPGSSNSVEFQRLHWDSVGKLTLRVDGVGDGSSGIDIADTYTYDELGRLTKYVVSGNGTPNVRAVDLQYNALGMLLYKSDVGIYSYPAQGVAYGRPHAVQGVSGMLPNGYGYDLNGNATSASAGKWRGVAYTSFNLPDSNAGLQGAGASPKYTWQYDEGHARIRETRVNAQGTRTTWNLHPDNQGGLGFEREEPPTGAASNRHYISAGGGAIAVVVTEGALPALGGATAPAFVAAVAAVKLEYWHKDHLGSLVATTSHAGVVTARYSYDPFGKRRNITGTYDPFGAIVIDWAAGVAAGTDRGYTGHEHLDDAGVVHMNGRIFDPAIGKFMQADPLIQEPDNLQNYDRFGYCFNNPATCADPSGYSFWTSLRSLHPAYQLRPGGAVDLALATGVYSTIRNLPGQKAIDSYVLSHPWLYSLGVAAAGYWGGPIASAAVQGYAIYASGGTIEQAQRSAMRSMATAAAFYAVGSAADYFEWSDAARIAAHAAVGCASAEASGGACKSGALSAGFSEAATLAGWQARGGYGVVSAAAIGGVSSVLGGGKFANGAITAAYGYLFNCLAHSTGPCGKGDWAKIREEYAACGTDRACMTRVHAAAIEAKMPGVPSVIMSTAVYDFVDWTSKPFLMLNPYGWAVDTWKGFGETAYALSNSEWVQAGIKTGSWAYGAALTTLTKATGEIFSGRFGAFGGFLVEKAFEGGTAPPPPKKQD